MAHSNTAQHHWFYRRLEGLYAAARDNEQKIHRFQSFELRLMASTCLPDLLRNLLFNHKDYFSWDLATLSLVDSTFELRQLCDQIRPRPVAYPELQFLNDSGLLSRVHDLSGRPRLGLYNADQHGFLFDCAKRQPDAITLLPLFREQRLIGSFNIGTSVGSKRQIHTDTATDFLQHLAAVISVCLFNGVAQEKLRHLGVTDALTGVNNRRYFDQRLPEEIARASRDSGQLSCMFIDLDRFKSINDTFGHPVGDKVLRATAQVIQNQLRTTDVVARYGGEEFAVLLTQTDNQKAIEIAERIRRRVEDQDIELESCDKPLQVSVSIGVASLSGANRTTDIAASGSRLVASADKAVYQAKATGRNRVINGNNEESQQTGQGHTRRSHLQHS